MTKIKYSKIVGNTLQEFTEDYLKEHKDLIEFVKKETEKQLLSENKQLRKIIKNQNTIILREQIIEELDKYDSNFQLETGEGIQAIWFYDFGKVADGLLELFNKKKI